jgi:aryl-alcohol dehydrogenase-like predicted oxidoreductase
MIEKTAFGKTGHRSTRTLFGAAALAGSPQAEADRILDVLLRYGVNHIDVAASYGEAELRVGPWMAGHRADFFLASKTEERSREKAGAQIRLSLERLRTDHLDLIQLHAVTKGEELDAALGAGGALEAALEAREKGLVRFIGITSHGLSAPDLLLTALDRFAFDSVLLPCNHPILQIVSYAEGFRRLESVCREREVALQTIKSICRRPWREGAEKFATTWYEPLAGAEEIAKTVGFVLGRPGLFLNTVGDVRLLPLVLEAADRYSAAPSDAEMRELAAVQDMASLWPETETAAGSAA